MQNHSTINKGQTCNNGEKVMQKKEKGCNTRIGYFISYLPGENKAETTIRYSHRSTPLGGGRKSRAVRIAYSDRRKVIAAFVSLILLAPFFPDNTSV